LNIHEKQPNNNNSCTSAFSRFDKFEFRYVIVPGGQPIGPQSLNPVSSLKKLPYSEIQKRFNLPD